MIARRIALRCLRLFFLICAATGSAGAFSRGPDAPPSPPVAADPPVFEVSRGGSVDVEEGTLFVNRRRIVTFRATLLDDVPAVRAQQAEATLERMLAGGGPAAITLILEGTTASLKFDGERVFHLVADDVGPSFGLSFDAAAEEVRRRLQAAVLEVREKGDARRIGEGLAWSAGATLLALVLLRGVFWLRRKLAERLDRRLAAWQQDRSAGDLLATYAEHARRVLNAVSRGLSWVAAVVLIDAWLSFVLHQFAWSRPWGERSTAWLLDVLAQFAWAIAGAIPGLVIAVLIFLLARISSRALGALLERVERGEARVAGLDIDTAGPTRRLGNLVIWLFALAMAYPYLPGSHSEAFKGVSVLAGLMLSLGASSIVGQVLSGFSLMYSRSLRPGEYVKAGDTEGTVMNIGLFATRIHTGMGEEVSIPNAVMFSQPVRNFSRLVTDGHFVVHTTVTIGYATPWRQVHAMLLEAARRTPGVAQTPSPYVLQTALSDFYVEYRMCAQIDKSAPARRAEALNQLHGNIQDVFNEYGVQIMSPHYMADTPTPQVVPQSGWWPSPAQPPHEPERV
ncbi:mechanosensitive ion channel family protein [Methyloversatilis sp. XJ19-13]|uniref:mechanosensitive ion channel family protein n=1 Tax=Methyloversatilis sp. XJ19-13 TaxID=2963430 RepID=UPI00211C7D9B|nr:mechanosensitive ion channel family protein [Methyloversatilis sp. XJ19-13]